MRAEGPMSRACEATTIQYGGATLPLARTVNGQLLTSAEPIKPAADTELAVLLNAGPPFLETIGPGQVRPSVRPPNQPAETCATARSSNG